MQVVDAFELLNRCRMIIDAQVAVAIIEAAVAGAFADDEQRCGLPPALSRKQVRNEESGHAG